MKREKLFPGPSSPWWWQAVSLIKNSYGLLGKCIQKYGAPFSMRINSKTQFVFFNTPEAARDLFTANYKDVFAGPISEPLRPVLGGKSLLLLDDDEHLAMRRFMTPPFTGNAMRNYGEIIRDISVKNTRKWGKGTEVTMQHVMQTISMEVILHAVFDLHEGERFERYKRILLEYLSIFNGKNAIFLYIPKLRKRFLAPWAKYLRTVKLVDELIYEEINLRKQSSQQNDILSRLLAIRDEDGNALSDLELRDQLVTLLLAGHETTAASMTWCLYWIHHTPEVLPQLCDELRGHTSIEDIAKLPFLDAVCRETLRLYPIVPAVGRLLQRPVSVAGHELPEGTAAILSIYLTHRNPDVYPNPEVFYPQRFLERKYDAYEFVPFGGGARRCLGMHFALYEMKIVIAHLLQNYQLELCSDKPVSAVRRGVTFFPKGGIPMVVRERRED
ncbi:cytochrome P450 [Candidatus Uabimicrobium amorphum]|uniref:Cytochrome P450 n=1 Tax=Uabimicrobium amorphum TaxID=2596890 RepID=A0A5S9IP31_UABAM|nr:cytochrome P450 [Candidatus Uabimicrobium amorphum]BBM85483.1 cytochrome P450 [Candidatus Uabimicrobium amorphum]